jgi:hypothetical protein
MMPGLLAMFSLKGWMVLLWGIALLPIGFAIQAVGLLKTKALPHRQSALFLVGVLFVGFPDGAEIVNLTASIMKAVALVPYGMRLPTGRGSEGGAATTARESLGLHEAHREGGVELLPSVTQACTGCRRKSAVDGCIRSSGRAS